MNLRKTGIQPLDQYCESVMDESIPVCKWVRLAVERHFRDLERAENDPDFPYYFEPKACMHYVDFFADELEHYDGIHKGKSIIFEPWQYFVWGSVFGWLKDEKLAGFHIRRFRKLIVIIPKKQGKSIIIAGTMLYMMDWDGWPGAQIYALAKNRSHAEKLGYRDAETMVKNSEELLKYYKINKGAAHRGIYCAANDSFIQPLTSKPDSTDGLKVHMSANDEVKDWTDHEIYNIMVDGTAANPNSLIADITTAGDDRSSVGYEKQEELKKILNQTHIDEQTFGVIYTIDKGDKEKFTQALALDDPYPAVEPIIKKANPNYGVSVGEDYYRSRVNDARNKEKDKNSFFTKHLNIWINAMDNYFDITSWINQCKDVDIEMPGEFAGRPIHLFADLASKKDICSLYALIPYGTTHDKQKRYFTAGINFLPEVVVSENIVGRRSEYNAWAEMGHFQLTPGNVMDFDAILDQILWFNDHFRIMKMGFDEWNAYQLANDVQKKRIRVLMIKQNTKNLSEPMKQLDSWISYRRPSENGRGIPDPRIIHNGDPVLTWALGNVVAKEDANENVFPRKDHKDAKIDPGVSLINLAAMEIENPLPKVGGKRRVPKVWGV